MYASTVQWGNLARNRFGCLANLSIKIYCLCDSPNIMLAKFSLMFTSTAHLLFSRACTVPVGTRSSLKQEAQDVMVIGLILNNSYIPNWVCLCICVFALCAQCIYM